MPVKTEILKVRISKEQKQTLDKLKCGERSFELAKEYNVSQSTICAIKNKRTHI